MYTWIRVLIVHDSPDSAQWLVRELHRGGFKVTWERVATAAAVAAALDRQEWDLVIADATLPGVGGTTATALFRDHDLPCIASGPFLKGHPGRLVSAVEGALREAERRRAQRHLVTRVGHLAYYDAVTHLPNRALLDDRLRHGVATAHRAKEPLAFLTLDLDGIKEINNALGHNVGDAVLRQVGSRIGRAVRDSDTIARLGDDEFAVVLPGTDADRGARVVERILRLLEPAVEVEGMAFDVEVRIGVALFPAHGTTPPVLMRRAKAAMSAAKATRSRYAIYAPEHDRHTQARLAFSRELRDALKTQQLVWHYQPKVDLRDKRVLGFEVLTYWLHPTERLLPPGRFIGLAEQTGLIRELTLAAIETALRSCRQWQAVGPMVVAVNLSPRTLQDDGFLRDVGRLIDEAGLPPACLELEITEGVMMTDPVRAVAMLGGLRDMGIRLSIDDFGTGYASLSYLRTLPVHELKIDRSFVIDLARHGDEMIVRSMIDLAHNLGLTVLAEGVETRDAWDRLAALDCNAAQGFYISPPVPRDATTAWLNTWRESAAPPS